MIKKQKKPNKVLISLLALYGSLVLGRHWPFSGIALLWQVDLLPRPPRAPTARWCCQAAFGKRAGSQRAYKVMVRCGGMYDGHMLCRDIPSSFGSAVRLWWSYIATRYLSVFCFGKWCSSGAMVSNLAVFVLASWER